MSGRMGRRGVTLVELMVAVVIGGILLGALYQLLLANHRVSAVHRETVLAQQTLRAGLDLLAQEIREVSAAGGDLTEIEASSISFRALRAFGVACDVDAGTSLRLTVAEQTRPFAEGEDVFVFVAGDPAAGTVDEWLEGSIQSVEGGETCGGDPARELTLVGIGSSDADRIRQGAPVRSWEEVAYALQEVAGSAFLVRIQDGSGARLVGPLEAEEGLAFAYLDGDGDPAADAGSVRRVQITLRARSEVRDALGRRMEASLSTVVYLRN